MKTAGLLLALVSALMPAAAAAADKPNLVVLMVDDLDVRSYDALLRGGFLPNIKRELVDKGVSFQNSFVTNAICCPSRATMLTGQYTKNHGVLTVALGIAYWLSGPFAGSENNTLATWLKAAGYRTAHVGKYLNGYGYFTDRDYVPVGYDEWQALLDPGTYLVYNYQISENGVPRRFGSTELDYSTDVLSGKATNFVNDHFTDHPDKPMFMVLTPIAPHIEINTTGNEAAVGYLQHFYEFIRPAPRHMKFVDGFLANGEVPGPVLQPSFNEADVSDKPAFVQALPLLDSAALQAMVRQYKWRLASVMAVDDMVGALTKALADKGELENTVILFTSDNGYFFGEHRLSQKIFAYEESIRVPLVVRGPGFARGATSTAIALNTDIAPTFVELGGATSGRVMDGRSLGPVLRQPAAPWSRKQFMVEHYKEQSGGDLAGLGDLSPETCKAVRRLSPAQNALYVEWNENPTLRELVTFREYFNMGSDPHQMGNTFPTLSSLLRLSWLQTLQSFRDCAGPTCKSLEDAP